MAKLLRLALACTSLILLSGSAEMYRPYSFTFYGVIPSNAVGDFTISWPWTMNMHKYNTACGGTCAGAALNGAGAAPGPNQCFYITRVFTWNTAGTPIMVGKLDVKGYGGDYITPGQLNGVGDSGWYPPDLRPLFRPGDELHIHTTGSGNVALATIFYILADCDDK